MNDDGHITIHKMTVGLGTGAGGVTAKAVAEGFHFPTVAELIGYMTVALLALQIFFLLLDRYRKYRRER